MDFNKLSYDYFYYKAELTEKRELWDDLKNVIETSLKGTKYTIHIPKHKRYIYGLCIQENQKTQMEIYVKVTNDRTGKVIRVCTRYWEKLIDSALISAKKLEHEKQIRSGESGWFHNIEYFLSIEELNKLLVSLGAKSFLDVEDSLSLEKEIEQIDECVEKLGVSGKEREAVIKVRVNQGEYRRGLIRKYKKCCLCDVSVTDLLIASHIKPWAVSSSEEKGDFNNGLLLCPTHDKLFDKCYISFADDGSILISNKLDEANRSFLNINEEMHLEMSEETRMYMKYHREMMYEKCNM